MRLPLNGVQEYVCAALTPAKQIIYIQDLNYIEEQNGMDMDFLAFNKSTKVSGGTSQIRPKDKLEQNIMAPYVEI